MSMDGEVWQAIRELKDRVRALEQKLGIGEAPPKVGFGLSLDAGKPQVIHGVMTLYHDEERKTCTVTAYRKGYDERRASNIVKLDLSQSRNINTAEAAMQVAQEMMTLRSEADADRD